MSITTAFFYYYSIPLNVVNWFGDFFDVLEDHETVGRTIRKERFLTVQSLKNSNYENPFEISSDLLTFGISSILQDDLRRPFHLQLGRKYLLKHPNHIIVKLMHLTSFLIRWFFIFPLRICFLMFTVIFLIISALTCFFLNVDQKYSRYFGISFAKFFNISTGLIISSHNTENRPEVPGIVVSNHISANDVMTIYADADFDGKGYTVTAQAHGGIVHFIEKYGGYLTPVLLINRFNNSDRNGLKETIIRHAKEADEKTYPVLLFPEGYCTNNKCVLQFRKAVFDGHVRIYPIALKQNSRFGDQFWAEKTYLPYLIRLMTSWCSIIEIFYLPHMSKYSSESDEDFARRVQCAIAEKLSVDALPYDGSLTRPTERSRYQAKLQNCIAQLLNPHL